MSEADAFTSLGISLALGLLVGLQRQRSEDRLGGLRTFALATVLGTIAAILAVEPAPADVVRLSEDRVWIPAAGLLAIVAVLVLRQRQSPAAQDAPRSVSEPALTDGVARSESAMLSTRDVGLTTELAMLAMYLVGVLVVVGPRSVAVALGAGIAVLLQAKFVLHRLAAKLGEQDLTAIFRFVLISLVILPVLPNRTFGPYDVFNPHLTWLMVVLIVGISLVGYITQRYIGDRAGPILTGLLGGMVSSTATTASVARRTKSAAQSNGGILAPALIVMIAGTVMCVRIMLELFVVARGRFGELVGPIAVMLGVSATLSFVVWLRARRVKATLPPQQNPTELKAPIVFACIYTTVQFAVAAAKDRLGDSGLYAVAAISGLTDMDAITLSMGRMTEANAIPSQLAWRGVVIAFAANLVSKCAIVAMLGSREMLRMFAVFTAASFVAVGLVLMFWP